MRTDSASKCMFRTCIEGVLPPTALTALTDMREGVASLLIFENYSL